MRYTHYILFAILLTGCFDDVKQPQQIDFTANKEAGEAFLAENTKKEDVVTLPSGLQYKIITSGTGTEKPTASSSVTVSYTGTFVNDSEFDSSSGVTFPVNGVIAGWSEALQLMVAGDKWVLYIPHELAYGAQGIASIPPYSTLIFEVELMSIQ